MRTNFRYQIWILPALLACATQPGTGWGQSRVRLDLESFRTEVSPSAPDQDALFLKDLIPALARRMFPPGSAGSQMEPQTIDVGVERESRPEETPGKGVRIVQSARYKLDIRGNQYLAAAENFLSWRKAFETSWIEAASGEITAASKTPLALIFEDSSLSKREKIVRILQLQAHAGATYSPPPTPHPEFWPVSKIIEMPEIHARVQFNPRGGKVTILEAETGRAWVIPFNPTDDPIRWMRDLRVWAEGNGLSRAVERMRAVALGKATEAAPPKPQ